MEIEITIREIRWRKKITNQINFEYLSWREKLSHNRNIVVARKRWANIFEELVIISDWFQSKYNFHCCSFHSVYHFCTQQENNEECKKNKLTDKRDRTKLVKKDNLEWRTSLLIILKGKPKWQQWETKLKLKDSQTISTK